MNRDSINEMEQIQNGLEQFLQQEVAGYKEKEVSGGQQVRTGKILENERELTLDFLPPGSEAAEKDSNDIHKDRMDKEKIREKDMNKNRRTEKTTNKKKNSGQEEDVKPVSKSKSMNKTKKQKKNNKREVPPEPPAKGGKKKKSKMKRFLITILIIIIVLAGLWYWAVGSVYSKINFKEVAAFAGEPMKEDGVTNILLIGNDSRSGGEDGRSDAMILLSVSNKTKTIHMTSLLRDMYVEIPGHKGNRLNAAYSYGGAQLLMETIEQNLGISVNRYVLVNFQAFADLIDAVGGVELELTNEEVIYINGYLVEYNILFGRAERTDYLDTSLSGMIHLNGPQALAYSRNRYLGTDFERTQRQRKVLSSAIKKVPMALLTSPKKLTNGLLPNLTTNLTKGECLQLSLLVTKLLTYEMVNGSIPVEGSYKNKDIRGMAVLEVDFEKNEEYIRSNIYGK